VKGGIVIGIDFIDTVVVSSLWLSCGFVYSNMRIDGSVAIMKHELQRAHHRISFIHIDTYLNYTPYLQKI